MNFPLKRRIVLYSSLSFIIILVSIFYIVWITPKTPKTGKTIIESDRPRLPWIYNIREVTALMRKHELIDQFGHLKPHLRFSESKAGECFRELMNLGILELLRKETSSTDFPPEDYFYGLQTLRALTDLAKPYVENEIRNGNAINARKAAVTLSVFALNYPRGTFVGNTMWLRIRCSDLLREMELVSEWENLIRQEGCLISASDIHFSTEGSIFAKNEWKSFLKSAKEDGTWSRYVIRQFSSQRPTKIHICNFRNAMEGEVAVFAAQQIIRKNWFEYDGNNEKLKRIARKDAVSKSLLLKEVLEDKDLCWVLQEYFRKKLP